MGRGQRQRPEGDARDTINAQVVPIIFVPGVMGSRLDISGTVFDWDPDDKAEMADWVTSTTDSVRKRIAYTTDAEPMSDLVRFNSVLHETPVDPLADIRGRERLVQIATQGRRLSRRQNLSAVISRFYERRGWGSVVWSFYGPILLHLQEVLNPGRGANEPHPVYAIGYDWRQSNTDSGNVLLLQIQRILEDTPLARRVIVVSHSMGGLVTRAALAAGGGRHIAGVVHTVMPADGAVVAYRRFFTGAKEDLGDGEKFLCDILGNTPYKYFETQSGARGPIELLPHDSYPQAFVTVVGDRTNLDMPDIWREYMQDDAPGIVPHVPVTLPPTPAPPVLRFARAVRSRLAEARTFAASVAGVAHPNTCLLIGDGLETDVAFDWRAPSLGQRIHRALVGDGTVPTASAQFRAVTIHTSDAFQVAHAECFQSPEFRAATEERVRLVLASMS